MQARFAELREALSEFVEQRESLMLVLWHRTASGVVFAHKFLEAMEQSSRRDVFVSFAD